MALRLALTLLALAVTAVAAGSLGTKLESNEETEPRKLCIEEEEDNFPYNHEPWYARIR